MIMTISELKSSGLYGNFAVPLARLGLKSFLCGHLSSQLGRVFRSYVCWTFW